MRIGIAASEMEGEATGVGRAVAGLLDGLAESDFDGSVVAYFRGSRFDHPLWDDPRFEPRFSASGASPVAWEQRQLPSQIGDVDLFLGPAYALPRRLPCPGVVIIHDLSFEVLPDEFGLRERWRRRWLARRAAHQAARVLTVSGRVASEIEARYGTPASKIGVLRWGVDARTFTPTAPCNALGAEDPYLLFVGALLPRRRPTVMLDAFAEVAKERPELSFVIAGTDRLPDGGTLESAIRERDLADRVVRLGWVDETDLPGLIGGAAATIYLSTYEGFGIPPLESLACGTLAVVSAGLALDDLWPDYPYRARNLSGADVARSLRAVLATSPQTEAVREQGLALARSLTWRKCAEAFLEEIESLR